MFNFYISSILREMAGSLISTAFDLLPSFNGFDGLTEAHGGAGSTYNKRKRAKNAAKSGASGGGLTPKTDVKKQELVRKLSQKALKDPKNFRKTTSLASRKIVANFQLEKQKKGKDDSVAIQKSIKRMANKQMTFVVKTGKRPKFGPQTKKPTRDWRSPSTPIRGTKKPGPTSYRVSF